MIQDFTNTLIIRWQREHILEMVRDAVLLMGIHKNLISSAKMSLYKAVIFMVSIRDFVITGNQQIIKKFKYRLGISYVTFHKKAEIQLVSLRVTSVNIVNAL